MMGWQITATAEVSIANPFNTSGSVKQIAATAEVSPNQIAATAEVFQLEPSNTNDSANQIAATAEVWVSCHPVIYGHVRRFSLIHTLHAVKVFQASGLDAGASNNCRTCQTTS